MKRMITSDSKLLTRDNTIYNVRDAIGKVYEDLLCLEDAIADGGNYEFESWNGDTFELYDIQNDTLLLVQIKFSKGYTGNASIANVTETEDEHQN